MKTIIDTSRYFRSHMKQPRGRGLWLFEDTTGQVVCQHNGTYTEACAAARRVAHWAVIYVCP